MKILNTDTNEIETLEYSPDGIQDFFADICESDDNIVRVRANSDYDATADAATIAWWREYVDKLKECDGLEKRIKEDHPHEREAVMEEANQWHSLNGSDLDMELSDRIEFFQNILDELNQIQSVGWIYHSGSSAPDWYEIISKSHEGTILLESATMGSSVNNEWYAFRDRAAAVKAIRETFHRQAFGDEFTYLEDTEEYYRTEDLEATETEDGEVRYSVPEGVTPASLADMIACESRF